MEGFRILEITQPSELHVTANQLTIEQQIEPKKKKKVSIPMGLYQFEEDFQEEIVDINDFIALYNSKNMLK